MPKYKTLKAIREAVREFAPPSNVDEFLADFPATQVQLAEAVRALVSECTRLYKVAAKYEESVDVKRPRGYLIPYFPKAFSALYPKEDSELSLGEQVNRNYSAAIEALDLALLCFHKLYPSEHMQSATYVITEPGGDKQLLTMHPTFTKAILKRALKECAKEVQGVDPDNFSRSLFYFLLRQRGFGIVSPVQEVQFDDLLLGKV